MTKTTYKKLPQKRASFLSEQYVGLRGLAPRSVPIVPGESFVVNGRTRKISCFPVLREHDLDNSEIEAFCFKGAEDIPPCSQRMFFRVFCVILNIVRDQSIAKLPDPYTFTLTQLIRRLEGECDDVDADALPKRNVDLRKYIHHIVLSMNSMQCETNLFSSPDQPLFARSSLMDIHCLAGFNEQGEKEISYTYRGVHEGLMDAAELFRLYQYSSMYSLSYMGPTGSQIRQMEWTAFVDERLSAAVDYGAAPKPVLPGMDLSEEETVEKVCTLELSQLYMIAGIKDGNRMGQKRLRERLDGYLEKYSQSIKKIDKVKVDGKTVRYRIYLVT